jgi:hypothetical protein
MHLKTPSRLALTAWLAVFAPCVRAAEFAPPAVGPVAFRRDRVPLAARTMAGLSRNLETIARALPGDTPVQRQAAARALALAIALAPANEEPRKLLEIYQNGGRPPEPDAARIAPSRASIWQHIAWLESPEAGAHGQALASCLKDVMTVADPENPKAAALREAGDKGAWAGWVPDIHAYEPGKIASIPKPELPQAEIVEKTPAGPEILLPKASVQTVFRQRTGTNPPVRWAHAPAPLQMRASWGEEAGFSLMIGPEGAAEPLMESARLIRRLLKKQHGTLPSRMHVRIGGGEFMRAVEEGKAPEVTAAAAVLASAAVTGREPDAVIIGQLDEVGAFKLPSRFWDQLQALGPGNGRRLVLPAAAAGWLPSLLAMEKPGFFMDYEVLLASDFRQLLEFSAKSAEGAVADAAVKFREIRTRAEGQDLRVYLANRFVRQRLEELARAAPFHGSTAMLLLQGSVDRPRYLSRPALASELRRFIEPMAWISQLGYLDSNSREISEFNAVYKTSRLAVDQVERYVAKADLDLWEGSRECTVALWKLNRMARARGQYDVVQAEIQKALADFTRHYHDMSEQLNREAGGAAR